MACDFYVCIVVVFLHFHGGVLVSPRRICVRASEGSFLSAKVLISRSSTSSAVLGAFGMRLYVVPR
jgi:hypothetical protein